MHSVIAASLTLAALVGGLEGEATSHKAAAAFMKSEVETLVKEERKTMLAPPSWFNCISEARSSKVLDKEVLRLYREEENARIMEPSEIIRWAIDEVCADSYYEN